jgi:hypothetical protein
VKKKELKRELAASVQHIVRMHDIMVKEAAKVAVITQEVVQLRADFKEYQEFHVRTRFLCPWCRDHSFPSASELRLHEQECACNRNRWRPDSVVPVAELADILKELGATPRDDVDAAQRIGIAVHYIKELKHRARPICIVCGASAGDVALMRKHMEVVHNFDWRDVPTVHSADRDGSGR